jgi:ribosomal protein S25
MGRKATVEKLPDNQYEFVIQCLIDGKTDREVEAAFAAEFPGSRCPKSSLANWRKISGEELVERYKVTRFLARTVAEELKDSGIDLDEDRYKQVIDDIESQLLVKTREIVAKDPLKLLAARQEEERLRIKREQIALNQSKLDFEKHKHEREASVRVDRLAIGAKVWQTVLYFMTEHEPHAADALTRRSNDVLAAIEGALEEE